MEGESDFRHWDELIPDALAHIFNELQLQEVLQVIPSVCKAWCKVVEGPYCWQRIDIEEWSETNQSVKIDRMLQTLITRSAGSLRELCVSDVDDLMFSFIAEHAGSLQNLILSSSSISDSIIGQVAIKFSSLTTLNLSYCYKISSQAFEAIGSNCKVLVSLTYIKLPSTVTELKNPTPSEDALTIARTMPKLKHLTLGSLILNDSIVLNLLSGCPELELLDIRRCRGVDKLDEEFLEEKYPKTKVVGPDAVDFIDEFSSRLAFFPASDSEESDIWGDYSGNQSDDYGGYRRKNYGVYFENHGNESDDSDEYDYGNSDYC